MTSRRAQILDTAAELFARRGFHGVSIAELGAACGISGPALYKHFAAKEAILAELLVDISRRLLEEGRARVARAEDDPARALELLVDWHTTFALEHRALIVVQDRDWSSLPDEAREQVRSTQRAYVDLWAGVLRRLDADLDRPEALARVHAAFGLINSTPHSALLPEPAMHPLLSAMALGALRG